ncbi:MAG TPA: c-type cytochrome [Magnetospirillum sp.]|nr:c-type cytochrome [Magnetospirillum sp.]
MKTFTIVAGALAAAVAAASPAMAGGSAANGKKLFDSYCDECHTTEEGGASRKAPNMFGLIGRQAGTLPGFEYTDANRAAGWVWTEAVLDRYLTAPKQAIPGTNMKFKGIPDADERQDVIAYLATLRK